MYYLWLISETLLESLLALGSNPFFNNDRKQKSFTESESGPHKELEELRLSNSLQSSFISTDLAQQYVEKEFPPLFVKIRQEQGLRGMELGALHANQAGLLQLNVELSKGIGVVPNYGYSGSKILSALRTEVVSILNEGSRGKLARMERIAPYVISRNLNASAFASRLLVSDVEVHNFFECRIRYGKFCYIRPHETQLDLKKISKIIETLTFAGDKQEARLATDIPVINQMLTEVAENGLVLVCHQTDEGFDYE